MTCCKQSVEVKVLTCRSCRVALLATDSPTMAASAEPGANGSARKTASMCSRGMCTSLSLPARTAVYVSCNAFDSCPAIAARAILLAFSSGTPAMHMLGIVTDWSEGRLILFCQGRDSLVCLTVPASNFAVFQTYRHDHGSRYPEQLQLCKVQGLFAPSLIRAWPSSVVMTCKCDAKLSSMSTRTTYSNP